MAEGGVLRRRSQLQWVGLRGGALHRFRPARHAAAPRPFRLFKSATSALQRRSGGREAVDADGRVVSDMAAAAFPQDSAEGAPVAFAARLQKLPQGKEGKAARWPKVFTSVF